MAGRVILGRGQLAAGAGSSDAYEPDAGAGSPPDSRSRSTCRPGQAPPEVYWVRKKLNEMHEWDVGHTGVDIAVVRYEEGSIALVAHLLAQGVTCITNEVQVLRRRSVQADGVPPPPLRPRPNPPPSPSPGD